RRRRPQGRSHVRQDAPPLGLPSRACASLGGMTIHIVSLLVGLVLGVVGGWLAWGRGRSATAPGGNGAPGREVARGDGTGDGDGWGVGNPDAAMANPPARVSDVAASIAPLNEAVGRLGAE